MNNYVLINFTTHKLYLHYITVSSKLNKIVQRNFSMHYITLCYDSLCCHVLMVWVYGCWANMKMRRNFYGKIPLNYWHASLLCDILWEENGATRCFWIFSRSFLKFWGISILILGIGLKINLNQFSIIENKANSKQKFSKFFDFS